MEAAMNDIILMMAHVDSFGCVELETEKVASIFGMTIEQADEFIDDRFDELEDDGVVTRLADGYYLSEILDEIEGAEIAAAEEQMAYINTVNFEWDRSR